MKICLIGCGGLANEVYGPSLLKYKKIYKNIELASCCDTDAQKAWDFKEKFGFQNSFTDIADALFETKPEAVFSVVPERFAEMAAVQILDAGFPLMLEKPPGISEEQARNIACLANSGRIMNQVAFNRRHMPLIKALKERLQGKEEPLYIQYTMARVGRTDEQFAWTAVHAIDAVRFIAGTDYSAVNFTYMPLSGGKMENVLMGCAFESGTKAQISIFPQSGVVSERIEVHTSGESFFIKLPVWGAYDTPGSLEILENGRQTAFIPGQKTSVFESNGFYSEIETFLNCIQSGIFPKDSVDTAVQTMAVMEALARHESLYVAGK